MSQMRRDRVTMKGSTQPVNISGSFCYLWSLTDYLMQHTLMQVIYHKPNCLFTVFFTKWKKSRHLRYIPKRQPWVRNACNLIFLSLGIWRAVLSLTVWSLYQQFTASVGLFIITEYTIWRSGKIWKQNSALARVWNPDLLVNSPAY